MIDNERCQCPIQPHAQQVERTSCMQMRMTENHSIGEFSQTHHHGPDHKHIHTVHRDASFPWRFLQLKTGWYCIYRYSPYKNWSLMKLNAWRWWKKPRDSFTLQLYKCVKMGCAVNKALINLSNTFLRMQFSKKQCQQKLIMLN